MLEVAFWTHRPAVAAAARRQVRPVPEPQVRAGRVRVVVGRRPAVQDRRDVRRHELEGQEDVLADEGPDRAAAVGVLRHQRVHRGVGHEQARDPPPLRQRPRRPHVGHRLPAPRGHLAQHRHAARPPTSAQVPVEETRLLLGLNAVRCYDLDLDALSAIAADIGPDARRSSTRTSTGARRPTRSARPASGSTTTASSGRAEGGDRATRRRRCSSTAPSPSSPAARAASGGASSARCCGAARRW